MSRRRGLLWPALCGLGLGLVISCALGAVFMVLAMLQPIIDRWAQ